MTKMKTATSQPIRIQRPNNDNQRNGGFSESKSSGNLMKLSQSLGTHAPGRLVRHTTNVSDIYYAGYLLKRSNRPVLAKPHASAIGCEDEKFDSTLAAAEAPSSPPSYTGLRHRPEIDIFNASDLDLSSSNLPPSPTFAQHDVQGAVAHHSARDSELEEFAQAFLGIDSSIGLFSQTAESAQYSPLSAQQTPPIRRTEPLQIPTSSTPDSYHIKQGSFRQTRRTSEPRLCGMSTSPVSLSSCITTGHTHHPGTPTDFMEHDQHVWRAKYCVLENGVLYFYRHQVDAESAEARPERQQLLQDLQQDQNVNCQYGAPAATARMVASEAPWRHSSLAMSPMPRPDIAFMNASSSQAPSFPRICEKYVALSTVGAVRSAELEHGPHSFALASENEDPLILRAPSGEDMNEWIFQFHRSIASYVMGIMQSCSSAYESSRQSSKQSVVSTRDDISPLLAVTLSPRVQKTLFTCGGPGAVASLSHGHGRTQLHRRRTGGMSNSIRLAQSFQDEPSPLLQGFPLLPSHDRHILETAAWSPSRGPQHNAVHQQLPDEASLPPPECSVPQSDCPETERPPPSTPGKYVPPQLRNKETQSTTECISLQAREQSAQRYVPPQLRCSSSKYVPPFQRNIFSNASMASHQLGNIVSPLQATQLVDEAEEDEDGVLEHSMMFGDAELDAVQSNGIKLGGCADPLLVKGSILDAMYIPRKSSRLGKVPTVPFGSRSSKKGENDKRLRFEVGAVSDCGIRESNEDSYLVMSDVLLASMDAGVDMSETVWGNNGTIHSPAIFAVFDGHCGDHAARFATERLLAYVQEYSVRDVDSTRPLSDRIEDVLRQAIRQMDDEFCNICVSDGRDWESGATALVAALVNEQLVIANLGDARGVICRSVADATGMTDNEWIELPSADYISSTGRVFWKQITSTHTPSREDERARIERANGWITFEKEIPIGQLQRMVLFDQDVLDILQRCFADRMLTSHRAAAPQRILQISRVCGELAVSRAIGDRDFKSSYNRIDNSSRSAGAAVDDEWQNASLFLPYPDNHSRSFVGDLVSNSPDFESIPVGEPGVSDEFLLLCCDGLWDVMDSDDAVRVTRDLLFEKGWSAKQAANRLAELAIHLGSSDNITVIVIRFFERDENI